MIYVYVLWLLVVMGLSFRQIHLLKQLFENKQFIGNEWFKFFWPFWSKQKLKKQYATNESEEVLIDKLVRLRTISSIIYLAVIIFLAIFVITLLIMIGNGTL